MHSYVILADYTDLKNIANPIPDPRTHKHTERSIITTMEPSYPPAAGQCDKRAKSA